MEINGSEALQQSASVELDQKREGEDTASPAVGFTVQGFVDFVRTHPVQLLLALVFLLIGYGQKLFSNTFSVDTEELIARPERLYHSWYALERFGLVALKYLTGTYWYNNALASTLMVLFFGLSALVWSYLLFGLQPKPGDGPVYFALPLLASPILAEMLGFLLLGPEIGIAISLVAVSLMCIWNAIVRRQWPYLVVGILAAAVSFSLYLAMTTIFVLGTALLMVQYVSDRDAWKRLWADVGVFAAGFVISYGLYAVANKVMMHLRRVQTDPYISDQSRWGVDSPSRIMENIWKHALDLYSGSGVYYSKILSGICIVFLVLVVVRTARLKMSVSSMLVSCLIVLSPMMMVIILGGEDSVRTEMSYAFAFAFMTMYILTHLPSLPLVRIFSLLVVLLIAFNQVCIVNRIFYTEGMVYHQDIVKAQSIADAIERLPGSSGAGPETVVFIGNSPVAENPTMIHQDQLEYTGRSIMSIGYTTNHSTWVKDGFFTAALGVEYKLPSNKQIREAELRSATMKAWPSQDSMVRLPDNTIVVKLS